MFMTRSNLISALTLVLALLACSRAFAGDGVPPSIVRAVGSDDREQVVITFNKWIDETTAETVGNYSISGGVTVLGAELSASERFVTLTTSPDVLVSVSERTTEEVMTTPSSSAWPRASPPDPICPAVASGWPFTSVSASGPSRKAPTTCRAPSCAKVTG